MRLEYFEFLDRVEEIDLQGGTIRISGTVPAAAGTKIASSLSAGDSTPATVWIQETGDHQLVQSKLDKSSGNSVQMTLSNWNQPVQVSKPQVS